MDFATIVRQLFALDPHQAPATLPTNTISSAAPPKLNLPSSRSDDGAAKVLATLRQPSTPEPGGGGRGPLGIATGPLPDVKGKSKGSAFFTGLAAGMNNAQNASVRDNAADANRAKANLDTMKMLFDQQQKVATLAETKRANDIREKNAAALQEYYKGIVENGRLKANSPSTSDSADDEHTIEMTKSAAARRMGLTDPVIAKQMASPIPTVAQMGKDEYARRKAAYDAWEKSFDARVGRGSNPVKAAVDAHTATGTDGTPSTGGQPTPPVARDTSKPAPTTKPAATGAATPPVSAPQTWQTIKRQMPDGTFQRQLWNPSTGETKPLGESGNTAPTPPGSSSFPSPPSVDEVDPATQPSEDTDSEE